MSHKQPVFQSQQRFSRLAWTLCLLLAAFGQTTGSTEPQRAQTTAEKYNIISIVTDDQAQ